MELITLNPWWTDKGKIREDKHIRDLEAKKYKWSPFLLKKIRLLPNNIYTLRGPRQVGKTTISKILIKGLLSSGIEKEAVFFWSCEELENFKELAEVIRSYLDFSRQHNIKDKYIFLDEISRIRDWQRAIKSMVDSGELSHSCIFITGSSSLDIKYGFERLPGRTGKQGRNFLLLPMGFSEYVELLRPDIFSRIRTTGKIDIKSLNTCIKTAQIFSKDILFLFKQYLITGGFPLTINEFSEGGIPDYVYDIYFRWLAGDIMRWGRQEKILTQIMRAVIRKQSSPISWDSLAKEAEVKSHKTISAYVEDMENMFSLVVLYLMKDPAKNKKIYFSDPFIFHVFNKLLNFRADEINPALMESVLVSHLCRFGECYYWKNKREVDIVLMIKEKTIPMELKYQNRIIRDDFRGLFYFRHGIMVTKDMVRPDPKYPSYPIHLFLSVIRPNSMGAEDKVAFHR